MVLPPTLCISLDLGQGIDEGGHEGQRRPHSNASERCPRDFTEMNGLFN